MKLSTNLTLTACFFVLFTGNLFAQKTKVASTLSTNASGQSGDTQPTVALRTDLISASPNAESLGKFGIVPVSLYTGVPDISIPLGTVNGREVSVPITLNYHHNGFKTYDIASWVGLGWSLNAGGVITRIIRDKLDETTPGVYKYENNLDVINSITIPQDYLDGASFKALYDTEPDIYTFNFGSYSGKFMIYKGKFYQFPYQKLRISGSTGSGFSITTPDGVNYSFHETELTHPKNIQSAYTVPDYTSSWFLSTISTASNKEAIKFNYVSSANPVTTHSAASQTYQKALPGTGSSILGDKQIPLPSFVYTKRLESITTPKMTVNFIPQSNARYDIANTEYALDKVIISGIDNTTKVYKFNYGYFGSGTGPYTTLKLLSLEELSGSGNPGALKRHTFLYNGEGSWPVQTDNVDHWGYANGANGSGTIIPNTVYEYGMNREPNMSYSELGMLKQIIYPTGGSSVFKFEPNLVSAYPHRYKVIPRNVTNYLNRLNGSSDNTLLSLTNSFTLDSAQTVQITYARTPKQAVGSTSPNGPNDPAKDIEPEITIDSYASRVASARASASSVLSYSIYYNRDNGGVTTTERLPAGTYQVTLKCDSKEMGTSYSIGYLENSNIPEEGLVAPGLRVKEISSYPTAATTGTPLLKKVYKYVDSGGFSTGVLFKQPSYGGHEFRILRELQTTGYQLYSSVINSSLGALQDQDMYYKLVNEYQVSPTSDLRSQHEFNSFGGGNLNGFSPFLARKTDYKKIDATYVPVFKHEYNYTLAPTDNIYFTAIKPYQTLSKIGTDAFPAELPIREYGWDTYVVNSGLWQYPVSEVQTTYNDNGAASVTSTISYVNDITKNFSLSAVKTKDSKGQEKIVKYKHPDDYDPSVSQAFLDAHLLSPVLEQQVWLKRSATDSVLLGGKVNEYDLSLFKPKASYLLDLGKPVSGPDQESKNGLGLYTSLLSDSQYKKRIQNDYDAASGNLVAQDLLSSATTKQISYIWGYKNDLSTKLYPIAECRNGALSDFFYDGFEDLGAGTLTGAAHTGKSFYNGNYPLSFAIPNASTTYFYSYWYRSSGAWKYSGELSYSGPLTLTGEAFDDIRVYPVNGQMTTYTYLTEVGLTSTTDAKGQTTYFEYDDFHRLMDAKDQNGNLTKTYDYHYPAPANTGGGTTPANCTGQGQKAVNGICENGTKWYDSSVRIPGTNNYNCSYHYTWSDGSQSGSYTEVSPSSCPIF